MATAQADGLLRTRITCVQGPPTAPPQMDRVSSQRGTQANAPQRDPLRAKHDIENIESPPERAHGPKGPDATHPPNTVPTTRMRRRNTTKAWGVALQA